MFFVSLRTSVFVLLVVVIVVFITVVAGVSFVLEFASVVCLLFAASAFVVYVPVVCSRIIKKK